MTTEERLDAAAAHFKKLEDRIRELETRLELSERTIFAKRAEMLKGYKLMAEIHTTYAMEHGKFLDELKKRIDELANSEV